MPLPKDRSSSRSQIPPPAVDVAKVDTSPREPLQQQAAVRAAGLRVRFTVTLTAGERGAYEASISDDKAVRAGVSRNPDDVHAEYARCVEAYAPWIITGRLRGYGPLRVGYAAELMTAMAPKLDAHGAQRVVVGAASSTAQHAKSLTRRERRLALRSLRNLTSDAGAKARIRQAAKEAATGRLTALQRIAVEVAFARERLPPRVLEDAGLTSAVLDALVAAAEHGTATGKTARDERQAAQVLRGELALPCGRLLHELRLLLASARDSRAFDPTIPVVSSWLVTRGAKRPAAAAPVTPPPAPPR